MATKSRSRSSSSRSRSSRSRGRKSSRRKYNPSAGSDVKREMHEFKRGRLKSGRSGKTVKSRKQAIAIGLWKHGAKGRRCPAKRVALLPVHPAVKLHNAMLRAVIFDIDGTLVDSNDLHA